MIELQKSTSCISIFLILQFLYNIVLLFRNLLFEISSARYSCMWYIIYANRI